VLHKTLTKKLDDRGITWGQPRGYGAYHADCEGRRLVWFAHEGRIVCIEGCYPRLVDASYTLIIDWKDLRNIRQAIDFFVGKL